MLIRAARSQSCCCDQQKYWQVGLYTSEVVTLWSLIGLHFAHNPCGSNSYRLCIQGIVYICGLLVEMEITLKTDNVKNTSWEGKMEALVFFNS